MPHITYADLKSAEDSLLLKFSRGGNDEALNELIARYVGSIRREASAFRKPGLEPEDLYQEGMIGLLSAVRCYREDGGAAFRTYALLCIRRQISTAVRAASRKKNIPPNASVSLDDELNAQAAALTNVVNPEDMIICRERIGALKNVVSHKLTKSERAIFRMYLLGATYAAMAKASHTSIKYIDNSLQRIKKKLLVSAEG